jgi:hypothetical protein
MVGAVALLHYQEVIKLHSLPAQPEQFAHFHEPNPQG